MKTLLLTGLLLLSVFPTVQADGGANDDYGVMMSDKEAHWLRYNGVSVNIKVVRDEVFSRRARAYYEASLTNPYFRPISCSIELISSRGVNEKFEVIDSKTHLNIEVGPRSSEKVCGDIEIKHGRGDDGLQWIESKGHLVSARNCMFID